MFWTLLNKEALAQVFSCKFCEFFLANHSNFNCQTFNCDWVKAIYKKQPLKWHEFSIRFVNHFACFCDEYSLDLLCPTPEP